MFFKRNGTLNRRRAFTLIELLVVVAIIGLLASIVVINVNNARKKGRDARRLSDLRQIRIALEMYYDDNGSYPVRHASSLNNFGGWTNLKNDLAAYFPSVLPEDPINIDPYYYAYDGGEEDDFPGYGLMCIFEYSGNFNLVDDDGGYYNDTETGCCYEIGLEPSYDMSESGTNWFDD